MRNYTTKEVTIELSIGSKTLTDLKQNYGLEYDMLGVGHLHDLDEVRAARQRRDEAVARRETDKDGRVPDSKRCVRSDKVLKMFNITTMDLWRLQKEQGLKNEKAQAYSWKFYDPDEVREAIQRRDAPVLKPNWGSGIGQEPVELIGTFESERADDKLRGKILPIEGEYFSQLQRANDAAHARESAARRGES